MFAAWKTRAQIVQFKIQRRTFGTEDLQDGDGTLFTLEVRMPRLWDEEPGHVCANSPAGVELNTHKTLLLILVLFYLHP